PRTRPFPSTTRFRSPVATIQDGALVRPLYGAVRVSGRHPLARDGPHRTHGRPNDLLLQSVPACVGVQYSIRLRRRSDAPSAVLGDARSFLQRPVATHRADLVGGR